MFAGHCGQWTVMYNCIAAYLHMHGLTFTFKFTRQDLQNTVFKCVWQNMCKASLSDMQGITFTGYEYIVQGITFTGYEYCT